MDAINGIGRVAAVLNILLLSSCATTERKEYFSVSDVSIDREECLKVDSRQLQFACHRFIPGEMIAVGNREFFPSRKADGSLFSKVTIMLPKGVGNGETFIIPSDVASIFYSYGPSAFAGKRGCYGLATSGQIEVLSIDGNSVEISFNGVFDMRSPIGWPRECGAKQIQQTWSASWVQYDSLGAWEGRPSVGDTPFEEAHPPMD